MDIGTLTGAIELDDQLSPLITKISGNLRNFEGAVTDAFGVAGVAAAGFVTVVVGLGAAIVGLGEKGSTLNDVEASFNRLAASAGTTGDVLRGSLGEGVRGTVDDMTLMQTTTRLLSSGMKLTSDDALLMGEASRALGKATGGDAASGLSILSGALTTGRVRALQAQGVIVDLKGAEETFAKSLGVTASELSREGKLHADRIAILQATQTWVDRVGISELSFKERILQTKVAMVEWGDSLAKSVAASPQVLAAYDAIKGSIVKAFGGDSQSLLNTIVGWVNSFASAVSTYGPPIIQTIADIWHGIQDVWSAVKQAWSDVPEWFKNIARDAGVAGVGVYAVSQALSGIGGTDVLGTLANIAQIWGTWASVLPKAYVGVVNLTTAWYLEATAAGTAAAATGLVTLSLAAVLIPLAAAYKVVQALSIAWDLWTQNTNAAKDASWQFAADQRNLALASEIAGTKVTDVGKAMQILRDKAADLRGETSPMIQQQREVGVVIGTTIEAVNAEGDSFVNTGAKAAEHEKKVKALLDTLRGSGDDIKVFSDAFSRLTTAELGNFEVQQRLVPQIEKLAAAGNTLTTAMLTEYEAAIKNQVAHQASADAVLAAKNYTLDYVKSQEALGVSQATLAIRAGVTIDQLKTYVVQLEKTQKVTDEVTKAQEALWSARSASQLKGLASQEADEQRALQSSYELGVTSAEALGKARSAITERYAAQQLALSDAVNERLKDNELTALDKRIKLEGIPQENGEKLKTAIVQTYALKRTDILGAEADRVAKAAADGATQVYDLQKQLADQTDRLMMTSTDYQIKQVYKQRDAELLKFKGLPEQHQAYVDQVNTIAAGQVAALKKDNDALKNNSQAALQAVADKAATTYAAMAADPAHYSTETRAHFKEIADAAQEAATGIKVHFGTAFLEVLKSVPQTITSALTGGGGLLGAAQAIGSQMGSVLGKGIGDSISTATKGLGALAGPIGAALGSLVGPLIGWIAGLFDHSASDFEHMGQSMGLSFSKGLIKQLQADKKTYGGEVQAMAIDLSQIISDAGGLNPQNLSAFEGKLRDVFSLLETHQLTVGQGTKILSDNWATFAKAGTDAVGLLDTKLVEIIALNDRFGLQTKEIAGYVSGQLTSATKGFTTALDVTTHAWVQLLKDGQVTTVQTQADLNALNEDMRVQQGIIDATGIHSQAAGEAVAGALAGLVATNMAAGMSFIDAVRAVGPAVNDLNQQFSWLGLSGGKAFDLIRTELELANDTIAGPALTAVEGFTAGLVGLANAGALTQDSFAGIAGQIAGTEAALVTQGYSSSAVMLAMRGDLQTIWELQQKYGYSVDDSTQALIDQGVQSGLIGEQGKTDNQKILDVLMAIGDALGAVIPEGLRNMGRTSELVATQMQNQFTIARGAIDGTSGALATTTTGIAGLGNAVNTATTGFGTLGTTAPGALDLVARSTATVTSNMGDLTKATYAAGSAMQATLNDWKAMSGFKGGGGGAGTSEGKDTSQILSGYDAATAEKIWASQIANPGSTQQDWNRVKGQYGFAMGGIVPSTTAEHLASGGMVNYYAAGMPSPPSTTPFVPSGTDTVPAMLTPGEQVLSVPEVRAEKSKPDVSTEVRKELQGLRQDIRNLITSQPFEIARALRDYPQIGKR